MKPIIGCEIFYAPEGRNTLQGPGVAGALGAGKEKQRFHHLVLLCKDLAGYQNLCRLVTQSYVDAPQNQKVSGLGLWWTGNS